MRRLLSPSPRISQEKIPNKDEWLSRTEASLNLLYSHLSGRSELALVLTISTQGSCGKVA